MLQPRLPARPRRARLPVASPPGERPRCPPIAGLGAGGHAKCASRPSARSSASAWSPCSTPTLALAGATVLGCPVSPGDGIAALRADGVEHAFVGMGGSGDAGPRRAGAALLRDAGFRLPSIVHRTATVARSARLAEGVQVLAGAIVGADARLRRDALVNAGAIVGHDVVVGECAHVASGARVAGGGRHRSRGARRHGRRVLQGRRVGERAVVARAPSCSRTCPTGARGRGPGAPLADGQRAP